MDSKPSRRRFLGAAAAAPAILRAEDKAGTKPPVLGSGAHTYEAIHDWGELPAHIRYGNTHGVVEDSQGHIYIHHTVNAASESADSMVVFDPRGKFVKSWGKEFKGGAHGLHIRKEGSTEFLYLCDTQRGVVVKATLDGEQVWSIGYPEQSDAYKPGADGKRPKYSPTNLAIAPNGDIYVGMATAPVTSIAITAKRNISVHSAAKERRRVKWIARTGSPRHPRRKAHSDGGRPRE